MHLGNPWVPRLVGSHLIRVMVVKTELSKVILAVITQDPQLVNGGAPIFIASSQEEQQRIALYLSRVLDGMVHDLGNGVFVIVNH